MNKCPKVGDRVSFAGANHVGPCVGVVTAIYPQYGWDEELDREGDLLPEREWHVSMKPDVLPVPWCYVGHDKFAPRVSELRRVEA